MTIPSEKAATESNVDEAPRERIWGSRLGWVVGVNAEGRLLVDYRGNLDGPLLAKRTLQVTPAAVKDAVATRQTAVLLFEEGDPRLPLLIGLELAPSSTPLLDALLSEDSPEPQSEAAPALPTEAHVDGQRVVIEGKDEVVLQCGQASITLRRNGKVVIRGAYVETHASGVNRIKGGSVQVN
ncbi:hypothetical protein DRW03_16410 [Corallococcus sp. H22C18031201]|uniref:DUF6484 domain-containing protein n=1 Tax=Citreicoccus inhibens TaxID=2849499 RepID=UPI000E727EB4|nr:DUF6484 domain-containing protein [Citreicoccus inhibens]MBU8896795.1 hypothetical protein [Citreicoccus inhibens]RJS21911.1 hypothetical protein DRW03_16410 [Corallococcus sp. H22C18031201]